MENKNSFVLYPDLIHTVSKLPDELAGRLFKVILEYVNDKNPDVDSMDLLVQVTFEPIRQQLKRDLKKWAEIREKRVEAGRSGGKKSGATRSKRSKCLTDEANEANASNSKQSQANEAVTVTVTDNVINTPLTPQGDDADLMSVFDYWNEKGIIKHRELNSDIKKAILKAIKNHGRTDILLAIDHYSEALNSDYKLVDYKWGLVEFLKQGNAMPDFFDDGAKWQNYQQYKAGVKPEPQEKQLISEFDPNYFTNQVKAYNAQKQN